MVKHNTDTNGIGYEWEYAKVKDDRTLWQKIIMGIYNPSSHEFLGRSAKSWGGILLFYVVFYSSLGCMFAICMKLLLNTLNDHTPHFTLDDSLIGTNPGLGYRPVSWHIEDGSLIYYSTKNQSNVKLWTNKLESFLEVYKNKSKLPDNGVNQQSCNYNLPPNKDKVCEVDVTKNMGPCIAESHYGYDVGQPCVFIKLNRIFNWKPEYYNGTDLPQDMPQSLKDKYNTRNPSSDPSLSTIWVSCDGETPADRESIGELVLHPQSGFPGYYYPYTNTKGYLSPLIAIEFKNPKKHTLINVECRAWAKNIIYRRSLQNREGSVHFELMID